MSTECCYCGNKVHSFNCPKYKKESVNMVTFGPNSPNQAELKVDLEKLLKQAKENTETKDTNPKDAVGIRKFPITTIPLTVVAEVGLAMMEGARKYGRHNYRVEGVRASVYIDAAFRHLSKWWDGCEDLDQDSGLSHITKAIAGLMVLRDAMICETLCDDRPLKSPNGFFKSLDKLAADIIEKYPEAKEPYLNGKAK